ncbi:MAG: glutamate racemase [Desulforhabdus sp.]|jgi:glutamate racemase|nr:glutamate racemase [Desulforhabdus sp.]
MVGARIEQPIGVFDSGVGGLTVLKALQRRLPLEDFLYLGDTARLPYGTKSAQSITRYALQAATLLVRQPVKLLVIACNTASSVALPALHELFHPLPIIGVIGPGAEASCKASVSGAIAVIATESTVRQGAYNDAISRIRPDASVISVACPLFVALAEEGWVDGPLVEGIIARYLQPLLIIPKPHRIDCLVLGCTHFPVLSEAIANVVGSEIALVDSAETTAVAVEDKLRSEGLLHDSGRKAGSVHFFATDGADRFARVGGIFLDKPISPADVEIVDL